MGEEKFDAEIKEAIDKYEKEYGKLDKEQKDRFVIGWNNQKACDALNAGSEAYIKFRNSKKYQNNK